MTIADLKNEILLPEREFIINKSFLFEDHPAIFASLTMQNDEIKIWIFFHAGFINTDIDNSDDEHVYETNRKEKTSLIQKQNRFHLNIQEVSVQGNILQISSSSGGPIEYHQAGFMHLQHFLEKGIDFSSFEDVPFDQFMIYEYIICEDTPFPFLDNTKPMPIVLKTAEDLCEVLVDAPQKFVLPIGEHLQESPYSYFDSEKGKHIDFYINRVIRYDIFEEYKSWFRDETSIATWQEQGLDEASITQMEQDVLESLKDICSKDQDLLLIQYETPKGIQLNFYTTEYLDTAPNHSSNGAVGLLWGAEETDSKYGYPVRTDVLKPVSKEFAESVEIELFSWYRTFPPMEIKI